MRLPALFLPLLLIFPATAQNARQPQSSSPQQGPAPTLRAQARLVVVDIVVTDKQHQPVHNLKASDFELFENSASQPFKSFEEHIALSGALASRVPPMPRLPPGVYTNYTPAPTSGPLNILLLDRLNTPLDDQMQMQKQIVDFLNSMKPGQRIAVFGLTNHLQYLQSFTTDPELLRAVIAGKGKAKVSDLLQQAESANIRTPAFSESAQDLLDMVQQGGADANTAMIVQEVQDMIASMDQFERVNTSFQDQMRAKYTLDAMNLLARYLSVFPGRKNLIWFSGSFPVNILPDLKTANDILNTLPGTTLDIGNHNPFAAVESTEKEFRQTSALLSRSQVAVYPVAVKGLANATMFYAESASMGTQDLRYSNGGLRNVTDYGDENFSNNSTMFMLADDTGGKATINTNDLTTAVEDAIEHGSNYYTIAYSPTNPVMDGGFRTILVKLRDAGYSTSYRRGYFAQDPDTGEGAKLSTASGKAEDATPQPPTNSMHLALTHGGPNPMQLIFSTRVQTVSDASEPGLAPGVKPGNKAGKGPYRRYRITYAIDPRELQFDMTPDGVRHSSLEFITYVYDAAGNLVDSTANAVNIRLQSAGYEQLLRTGLPYQQEVSVPVKGEYYLRIAMHDVGPDKVGAIEVPVALVSRLPSLAAAAAAAQTAASKK